MTHKPLIHFGTSGWRGVIADTFTDDNVRWAMAAIACYVRRQKLQNPSLIVGYDTRFRSEEFARLAVEVLSSYDIFSYFCTAATPTPTLAYEILCRQTAGGINFTASHNPPEYNGLKFSTADGAPALPEVTKKIEAFVQKLMRRGKLPAVKQLLEEQIDPRLPYLELLAQKVDLAEIRRARLRVIFDPLYGTGRGYLDDLLREQEVEVHTLHDRRDVLFGGQPPEPAEEFLSEAKQALRALNAQVVLATDGDADRFGIIDADGSFIAPNHILALLLDYLVETRPWKGGAARSVATTHLIDAVAKYHNIPLYETPVGFKYIGEMIKAGQIIIGGEESAGLSIYGHVPEKDGILACLLTAEMIARRGTSLRQQLETLFAKVGAYYPIRLNLHLEPEVQQRFLARLETAPARFDNKQVLEINRTDGLKLILEDGSWVLLRLSGTEPVVRCYCEAHSQPELDTLVAATKKFIFE